MEDWHDQRIEAAIEGNVTAQTTFTYGLNRFVPGMNVLTPQQNVARVRSLNGTPTHSAAH
ncbi:hypothetical protein D1831_05430 [Lactiplantibacillus garii]|uniref:Uncharacterized protein n=1 Tax=Lactiplantibacillus garii TaxID=2306423 RepID=A0A3R8J809_9LACO|nr:hypothetical protein [Lactiplantibacillus garii]RRK10871.1 hypothetical protein D1831_05430 [Lactiplantibacillus garii]